MARSAALPSNITLSRPAIRARAEAAVAAPTAFALAALSGVTYAAGFPPASLALAPWMALIPLLVACANLSPRRAAAAGMCWALTVAAGTAWFFPPMLSRYFGLGTVPSWLVAMATVGGLHGVYVGSYCAWVAWLTRRRAANPLLLAGGWLACEFGRAHGALGSPWALAAYSQIRWTTLIQIGDLAGPYGIGMLVAAVNACAAAALVPALRGRRPWLATATIAAALVGACAYGQWRLGQTFAEGDAIRVTVVQGGAPAAHPAERADRLRRYLGLSADAAAAPRSLIVWPEHAIDEYLEEPTAARDAVLRLSAETGADLVLGGPHYTPSASGTRYHNSAYLVRNGRVAARYDKHRLVPFAEDERFAWLLGEGATRYTPGDGGLVLPATALRLGPLLCVEAVFPDLVRQAVREGAELLVNLSNDAWFGHPEPARHQLDIATLRAVETRRYLVRAAATGLSAVIDPYGRTLVESEHDVRQVLHATVHASHASTPYERWGDAPAFMVIAAVAAASLRRNHNRRSA